jgi:diacylglycerol kinase
VDFVAKNKKFPLAKKAKDTASAAVYMAIWNIILSLLFIVLLR